MICAPENGVKIVAVVDEASKRSQFVGIPVVPSFEQIAGTFDAVLVTDVQTTLETSKRVMALLGTERVLVPALLLRWHRPAIREAQA
jgi:hypothetical protein